METIKTAAVNTDPVQPFTLAPGEVKFFRDYGFLVIPGLINEETAVAMHGEIMDIMRQIGLGMDKLKQTGEYLANQYLDRHVSSQNLRNIAVQLLGGEVTRYAQFTAVKGVGGGRFHFHQDNQYIHFDGPAVNIWMALTPMSPENGCLQMVPRSHLNGTLEFINSGDGDTHRKVDFEPEDFLPIRLRLGDCVAFTRLTVHGSGANTLAEPRVGYAVQFHRDDVNWFNDETKEWKSLKRFPTWHTTPVAKITIPKGKIDGH